MPSSWASVSIHQIFLSLLDHLNFANFSASAPFLGICFNSVSLSQPSWLFQFRQLVLPHSWASVLIHPGLLSLLSLIGRLSSGSFSGSDPFVDCFLIHGDFLSLLGRLSPASCSGFAPLLGICFNSVCLSQPSWLSKSSMFVWLWPTRGVLY